MAPVLVGGVDLSLTGLGLVAVPGDWGLDWSRVATTTLGEKLDASAPFWEQIRRLDDLVEMGVRWIEAQHCTHVFFEHYPMGSGGKGLFSLDKVAELGGALKVQLARELELFAAPVPLQTGRSTAVGSIPRLGPGKTKPWVRKVLLSIGMPTAWTLDEMDAWVAANYGLSLMGLDCVVAPRVEQKRPRLAKVEELIR